MLIRLCAATRRNRGARALGVLALTSLVLVAAGLMTSQGSEAAKGTASGSCLRCTPTPTPTPVPAVAPLFTAQTPPSTGTVGSFYSYAYAASGNPAPTFALAAGTLPSGLTLNSASGVLSGTPSASGSWAFQLRATNAAGSVVSATATVSVGAALAAPVFTSQTPPTTATVGGAYAYTFAASGNPAPAFALGSGTLPPGLSISAAGVLSGTPSAAGTYTFQAKASNTLGTVYSSSVTITVASASTACAAPPVWTAYAPPAGKVGQPYAYQFAATGDPTYHLMGGSFPPVLGLDLATGYLSGTPLWAGSWTAHLYAQNACGLTYLFSVTITVS
ncbi:MAG: Ig domain-containing protein [Dehalococcoidia bacterium]